MIARTPPKLVIGRPDLDQIVDRYRAARGEGRHADAATIAGALALMGYQLHRDPFGHVLLSYDPWSDVRRK